MSYSTAAPKGYKRLNGDEESNPSNLRKLKMNIENSLTKLQQEIKKLDDMKMKIGV